MGKSTYAMEGVVTSICVRPMGEGSNFCYFGAYVLIEWPLRQL